MALVITNNSDSNLVFRGGYVNLLAGSVTKVLQEDVNAGIFQEYIDKGMLELSEIEDEVKGFFAKLEEVVSEVVAEVEEVVTEVVAEVKEVATEVVNAVEGALGISQETAAVVEAAPVVEAVPETAAVAEVVPVVEVAPETAETTEATPEATPATKRGKKAE